MKILRPLLFSSLLVLGSPLTYGQNWLWGTAGYGSLKASTFASTVATDNNGNAYMAGSYDTQITFGKDTLRNMYGDNAYLVKYTPAGSMSWIVQPFDSGSAASIAKSVTTDNRGNIVVCGYFYGTIAFGNYYLRSYGNISSSFFIAKYSPAGNVIWAKQSVSPNSYKNSGAGYSVATDGNNNIFVAGYFTGTISIGKDTLIGPGGAFIAKYDSSGNVLWVQQSVVSQNSSCGVASVTTDKTGNAYLTGTFGGSIYWGSYQLNTSKNDAYSSAYVVKYSAGGAVLWAEQSININPANSLVTSNSICTDERGNIYVTGYFQDSIKFAKYTLYTPYYYTAFLTKYDTNGNVIWVRQSSQGMEGNSLAHNAHNEIYLSGLTVDTGTTYVFGGYTLHIIPKNNNNENAIILKFDTDGNAICGSILQNIGYFKEDAIASDSSGKYIYLTGPAYDTVKCGPDTLIPRNGEGFPLLGRWRSCTESLLGISIASSVNSSECIANGSATAHAPTGGTPPFLYNWTPSGGTNLKATNLSAGTYTITVTDSINSSATASVTITQPSPLQITKDSVNAGNGCDGEAQANVNGGSSPYTYKWTGGGTYDTINNKCAGTYTCTVTDKNGCMQTVKVTILNTAGVNTITSVSGQITIYPNPFTNTATIAISASGAHYLEVDDITGRKLKYIEFTGTQYELSAQGLAKGLYFIRAFDSNNNPIGTSKIVLQ